MLRIKLEPVGGLDMLGTRWRALEAQADGGFFRSWTFLGCLAEERFAGAHLLSVTQDGCDVALGLLGKAAGKFWLNQTGMPALDAPFIEHNGLLVRRGATDPTEAALAQIARTSPIRLAGVGDAVRDAASGAGWLLVEQTRWAPSVQLEPRPYLDTLSPGTRAQIKRSQRAYGPDLVLAPARSLDQALGWFAELCALHQASWTARGQPGAFATVEMRRFHQTLIARGWAEGQVDVLRVSAGDRVVGLLYVFVRDGDVLSYQSGFSYDPSRPREKPGLVSHALAIAHYAASGAHRYDLLAGADRYKLALARGGENLHWATLYRPWSGSGLAARARRGAGLVRAAILRDDRTTAPTHRGATGRRPDPPA